jgi:hypothetical protein
MVLPLRSLPPEGKTQVQVNKYNKGTQALCHPLGFHYRQGRYRVHREYNTGMSFESFIGYLGGRGISSNREALHPGLQKTKPGFHAGQWSVTHS